MGVVTFPIRPVSPQLPASDNALLPRLRPIVDPQVRLNIVGRDQMLKTATRFVASPNSGKRHYLAFVPFIGAPHFLHDVVR